MNLLSDGSAFKVHDGPVRLGFWRLKEKKVAPLESGMMLSRKVFYFSVSPAARAATLTASSLGDVWSASTLGSLSSDTVSSYAARLALETLEK